MENKHVVILIAVLAILIILFFALNKGSQQPVVSQSQTTHSITGLDGIIGSIQPGVLTGLGGGVANAGILGLFGQQSNAGGGPQGFSANGDGGPGSLTQAQATQLGLYTPEMTAFMNG